jgi:hypothetical protein
LPRAGGRTLSIRRTVPASAGVISEKVAASQYPLANTADNVKSSLGSPSM